MMGLLRWWNCCEGVIEVDSPDILVAYWNCLPYLSSIYFRDDCCI